MKRLALCLMALGAVGFAACNSDPTAGDSQSSQETTKKVADASTFTLRMKGMT